MLKKFKLQYIAYNTKNKHVLLEKNYFRILTLNKGNKSENESESALT